MKKTDAELVNMTLLGDKDAYDTLVKRYQTQIYLYLCKSGCVPEDAKGITQGVFIKAFLSLDKLKDPSKIRAWLYTIATNRYRNWKRKNKYINVPIEESIGCKDSNTPEEMYLNHENVLEIRKALNKLADIYKEVLILHYFNNLSYHQIADRTGLSVRTVETRIYRGRQILKSHLANNNKNFNII
ncbi:MAG: RNA polymerase sigma factor [Peptococcaceae bacterium]